MKTHRTFNFDPVPPSSGASSTSVLVVLAMLSVGCATTDPSRLQIEQSASQVSVFTASGQQVLGYHLRPPPGTKLVVESGGFFHPLTTPRGVVVTDFAPTDHPHHRGVFLGWVEMHGAKDADFWGWGEHAPTRNRRIVNRSITPTQNGFRASNDWVADDMVLIREELRASVTAADTANVLELVYRLRPQSDVTLSRWAFGGFCLRTRKDGRIGFYSPKGEASLPDPNYLKPDSDWPDAPWYAATVTLEDGKRFTAAVLNHPQNPPALWHNHRDVRMINPCIAAPAEVKLTKGKPLTLRYRVVAADGDVPTELLNRLAKEWSAN